jgi:RNA polymerase sigma-32 factor
MNRRLGRDVSLNAPLRGDGEGMSEWQDWLVDESPDQEERMAANEETENRRRLLRQAMGALNDRELRVLKARRLVDKPISLQELSHELGVSHQRVHQIELSAFNKVQMAVRDRALERAQAEATAVVVAAWRMAPGRHSLGHRRLSGLASERGGAGAR